MEKETKTGRVFTEKTTLGNRSPKRADVYLVRAAIAAGYVVAVVSDGHCLVKRTADVAKIFAGLDDVDEATIRVYDAYGERGDRLGFASCVYEYGQSPDEIIGEYSADGFVAETMDRFRAEATQ